VYHVKDLSCGENDPNFPFFDPVHGVYHLFYQDHVVIAPGHGPDIGHVVSRDMIHWFVHFDHPSPRFLRASRAHAVPYTAGRRRAAAGTKLEGQVYPLLPRDSWRMHSVSLPLVHVHIAC